MDMYKVMRTLREVKCEGVIIADHIPLTANDHRVSTAFSIGYMKALLERENDEFKDQWQTALTFYA